MSSCLRRMTKTSLSVVGTQRSDAASLSLVRRAGSLGLVRRAGRRVLPGTETLEIQACAAQSLLAEGTLLLENDGRFLPLLAALAPMQMPSCAAVQIGSVTDLAVARRVAQELLALGVSLCLSRCARFVMSHWRVISASTKAARCITLAAPSKLQL